MSKPHALIIGAGFTGVAIAHDLTLRGFAVTVLERNFIASGASGRAHGVLHSGGRYAVKDPESARECNEENQILRKIVPQVIEPCSGLFVALNASDLAYRETFLKACAACGIPTCELTPSQALKMEPNLNPQVKAAILVQDGAFDSLRLALSFAATAAKNGAKFNLYTDITGLLLDGKGNITGVKTLERKSGKRADIRGDIVINAAGAWTGEIAALADLDIPVKPTPGVMVAFNGRLVQRTINRLNAPGDGDIIQPQRQMVVVGTTSYEVTELDYVAINPDHVRLMLERGTELVPAIAKAGEHGVYAAARPLIGKGKGRSVTRTFKCFDHKENDAIDGLISITGGNATITRALAEKACDVVCNKLGINAPCRTRETPLASFRQFYELQEVAQTA